MARRTPRHPPVTQRHISATRHGDVRHRRLGRLQAPTAYGLPIAREVTAGQRLTLDVPGWTERRTMPGVTTFCPVTWCNNPLDGTNLTILICYQTHQMTMVSASLTVLYTE